MEDLLPYLVPVQDTVKGNELESGMYDQSNPMRWRAIDSDNATPPIGAWHFANKIVA